MRNTITLFLNLNHAFSPNAELILFLIFYLIFKIHQVTKSWQQSNTCSKNTLTCYSWLNLLQGVRHVFSQMPLLWKPLQQIGPRHAPHAVLLGQPSGEGSVHEKSGSSVNCEQSKGLTAFTALNIHLLLNEWVLFLGMH